MRNAPTILLLVCGLAVRAAGAADSPASPASNTVAVPPPQQVSVPPVPPPAPAINPVDPRALWCDTVVEMQTSRTSGVTSIWLSNGVRLHHLRMDRQPGRVVVTIALSGGKLLEDAQTRGLSEVAASVLDDWDTAVPEASRAERMEGRDIRIDAGASQDAITLRIWGSVADLEPALRVSMALLTPASFTPASVDAAKDVVLRELRLRAADPRAAVSDAINLTVLPVGDVRLQPPHERAIGTITPDRVKAWLERHEKENGAPIEAAIVGDIALADALRLADKSLGLLPKRDRVSSETDRASRLVPLPVGPVVKELRLDGPPGGGGGGGSDQRCTVVRGCFGPDMAALADQRALRAAVRIAVSRLKKRLTPPGFNIAPDSPAGGVYVSAYKGLGMVLVMTSIEQSQADKAAAAIDEELDRLADQGPTPEEVEAVGAELYKAAEGFERDPRYWSGVLARCTATGIDPDEVASGAAYYRGIKADTVRDALKKYHCPDTRIGLTIRPPERPTAPDFAK